MHARPRLDGIGRLHDVHAGVGVAIERSLGLRREIDEETALRIGDRHGRGAVLEDVHLLSQARVLGENLVQEVVDGRPHAMARSLTRDDDGIGVHELLDEADVLRRENSAVEALADLRAEDRVVLRERIATLHFSLGLDLPDVRMEHPGFLDDADQRVTVGAEHAVLGPDVQLVAPTLREFLAVELRLLLKPDVVAVTEESCHRWVRRRLAGGIAHAEDREICRQHVVGLEGVTVLVDPERRGEDLEREVSVHGRSDVRQDIEVAVNEFRGPAAVINRSRSALAAHVERAFRETEVLLLVNEQKVDLEPVARRGLDVELSPVVLGACEQVAQDWRVAPLRGVVGIVETRALQSACAYHCMAPFKRDCCVLMH